MSPRPSSRLGGPRKEPAARERERSAPVFFPWAWRLRCAVFLRLPGWPQCVLIAAFVDGSVFDDRSVFVDRSVDDRSVCCPVPTDGLLPARAKQPPSLGQRCAGARRRALMTGADDQGQMTGQIPGSPVAPLHWKKGGHWADNGMRSR